jgi:TRAP-type C4-dicarboxylate transport system permease small subunit
MRILRAFGDGLARVIDLTLLVVFLAMVAAITWQVFARYVLESPSRWAEELARFLMVWTTMLGSAVVLRADGHVAVTLFVDLLPGWLREAVAVVRDALILGMAGVLAWYGYGLAMHAAREKATGLGISMTYPYLAIPVGAVLIALFLCLQRVGGRGERQDRDRAL